MQIVSQLMLLFITLNDINTVAMTWMKTNAAVDEDSHSPTCSQECSSPLFGLRIFLAQVYVKSEMTSYLPEFGLGRNVAQRGIGTL